MPSWAAAPQAAPYQGLGRRAEGLACKGGGRAEEFKRAAVSPPALRSRMALEKPALPQDHRNLRRSKTQLSLVDGSG